MKKIICAILAGLAVLAAAGCSTRDGKVAMNVAEELMESGSYEAAAEQCAIAIGNGVKDKDFIHMSDVLKAYNAALSFFESGDYEKAKEKISEITDYSELKMSGDIETLKDKIYDAADGSKTIDDRLNEVKRLYDSGDFEGAQKKLYSLSETELNDNQRENYEAFERSIQDKLKGSGSAPSPVKHAGESYNYSQYDDSLYDAYIIGAETGNVYFWMSSSGDSYTTTLPNGTALHTTGHTSGGRTLVKYNGRYGWITSKYLSSRPEYNHGTGYCIDGAESGSVYVWKSAYGDAYYTTIPNGTSVSPTGDYENGRSEILWNGGCAWITSKYLY